MCIKQIGLLLRSGSDRQLLEQFLQTQGHDTLIADDSEQLDGAAELSLLFVDERSARTHHADLVKLKTRRHMVPVMLVVRGPGSSIAARYLSEGLVDDVLRMPVAKPELTHRLDVLLRLSDQSRNAMLRFERLFDDASWGVIVLEPLSGEIHVANTAFASMHGYIPAFLEKMPLANLVSPGWAVNLEEHLRILHETGAHVFESEHVHCDGRTFPVEVDATVYREDDGEPAYIGAYVRDITERKRAEQELLCRNEELRAAVQAKGDFLANITHEMRTPLHGALATLSVLSTTPLSNLQREYVQLVEGCGQALSALVNDVVDYSTLAAGDLVLEPAPFRLGALFGSVLELFGPQIQAKNLTLGVNLEDLPAMVLGDAQRLRQVVSNLVSNAVKFTDKGSVKLSARMLEAGTVLECRVSDTGVGIEPQCQQEIFEVFSQLDESTTRRFGGTGLGLALCHRLVALFGGQLSMASTKGEGSEFTFTVPLQALSSERLETVSVPCTPAPATPEAAASSVSVLVVEDNPVNQRIMMLLLEQFGCRAVVATDGLDGINKFAAGSFDLVIMDLQMPLLSGLDATGVIRTLEKNEGRARTPIVALTARVLCGDRKTCEEAGMDDFCTKPMTLGQLGEVLSRWVKPKP